MVGEHPKVFISHASEDKERFVLEFGEKLRNKGVDAWVDEWEVKPGDSLIDKIFEEGINKADYFIIVLSENSINKKWVREELNVATIRRIEENTTIIPLIIDNSVEIPAALKHIVWVPIKDLSNYDEDLEKIVMTIFGMDKKPPINEPPQYVNYDNVQGLSKTDAIVLKAIGDTLLEKGTNRWLNDSQISEELISLGMPLDEIRDSLEILKTNFYIDIKRTLGRGPLLFLMKPEGFLLYYQHFSTNFEEDYKNVISSIFNDGLKANKQIAEKTGCPEVLVDAIIERHNNLGDINLLKGLGGHYLITGIHPTGKRNFKEILEN